MNVPFFDLHAQLAGIRSEIRTAIDDVIESTQYIGGPKLETLERTIANYSGAGHAIGVSSGTDALLASLMALDVGHGDLVVTTPFSFFATAGVIARLGATPVFVDIDPVTYNMNPAALAQWFDEAIDRRGAVKAILPVHLFGQCADMGPILKVASTQGVHVLEDAAQALGAEYPMDRGRAQAGTMGLLGCFSFYPTKNLGGVGDGGMVVTDDATLAETLRRLRNHGVYPKSHHTIIGGNFRLDPIQAAVLLVKFRHLNAWQVQRREHAAYYDDHLHVDGLVTPHVAYGRDCHTYSQYVVSVPERRDALRQWLSDHGVGTRVYYPMPFHEQTCFAGLGYVQGTFPHSEHASRHTLALPVYPELTPDMQDHVIEQIGAFFR